MSKLFEARENSLIKPLINGEAGYVFKSNHINQVVEDIKSNKYGSYLIGGVVGTGKSSLVDIATSLVEEEPFVVHINFYNERECIEKFPVILLEKLVESIKESGMLEETGALAELKEAINICENRLKYIIQEEGKLEKSQNHRSSEAENKKYSIGAKLGIAINYLLKDEVGLDASIDRESKEAKDKDVSYAETITISKIQRDWLKDIEHVLAVLPRKKVVLVYDELDKMSEDVLGELFKRYKALFVEGDVFHYFLVNDSIFLKYSEVDLLKNPFYTYFMGTYYIPLLNLQETLRYSKMMFAENDYLDGLATYYISLGNYRLVNKHYLSATKDLSFCAIKAYVLNQVYKKKVKTYFDDWSKDVLTRKIKAVLEIIIKKRRFVMEEIANDLDAGEMKYDMWPQYLEIIEQVIEVIRELCPDSVDVTNEEIVIKGEVIQEQHSQIEELILANRREVFSEKDKQYIQMSDMYEWMKMDSRAVTSGVGFLRSEILPLKVADNLPKAYQDSLVNILHANLDERDMQVIILKRPRPESETYYENDYAYTGILVVGKGALQVAYYVDQGSYESDRKDAIEGIIKEAQRLAVPIELINISKYIDLETEMEKLVKKYNNPHLPL